MSKVLLVVNPSAGGEKAKVFEQQAKKKLASLFEEVVVKYTEKAGDATTFTREAANERYDSVFVMGGDGTVNEGISGLAELDYRPTFGFFPLGTVNDLARALGMSLDPEEAIRRLDIRKTKPLDIGKVNDQYFMNVVAIGTIPESINNVDPEQKTKWGKLAYFISGFKQLTETTFYDFRLTVDGVVQEVKSSTLLIGSSNTIGGFESILPEARVNDGLLHLIYLKDQSLLDTLVAVPALLSGHSDSSENIGYQTFQDLKVELLDSDTQLSINVDGDEGDHLPVKIRILPSHLDVYY
ncbi:diacylglycerol/lipid kinase family protein [Streptococcus ovuberis]|uniref:Diacylglycerol kinase family lipid kinase n=1 Tax=Streptococcus ovuberis TaxID=1936207 RepID=A0A7X6S1Y9_9STRE|nr:diacylglycerol kinase family protein [Streptococcus ovuberis]NKZ20855.1 diacylglycerol kinase family lipid kinase [Streptococcus ovuberis]